MANTCSPEVAISEFNSGTCRPGNCSEQANLIWDGSRLSRSRLMACNCCRAVVTGCSSPGKAIHNNNGTALGGNKPGAALHQTADAVRLVSPVKAQIRHGHEYGQR